MGAWDELDTELTVVNDVSALDDIVKECGGEFADIFEEVIKDANDLKTAISDKPVISHSAYILSVSLLKIFLSSKYLTRSSSA